MNTLHRLGAGLIAVALVAAFVGLVAVGSNKHNLK